MFSNALRLIAVASAYFLVFTALNSDLIVKAYVDPKEYSAAASMALMVLSLAAIVHTCTGGPGSSMLRGAGKPLLESVFHLSTLICFGVFFAIAKHAGDERVHPIVLSVGPRILVGDLYHTLQPAFRSCPSCVR